MQTSGSTNTYFDNGSTAFPKAPGVARAISDFIETGGYNTGRGGYASAYGADMRLFEARTAVAEFFGAPNAQQVIFTQSITYALNCVLKGFLKPGDHVVTTDLEHNAVMRPLHALGVQYTCAKSPSEMATRIGPKTRALVMNAASNVTGDILWIDDAKAIAQANKIPLILDTAQLAGYAPLVCDGVDVLTFTGHKSLLGPQGVGGFILSEEMAARIEPLVVGGTGSFSDALEQPNLLPDKYESGTLSLPAIVGLHTALTYLNGIGFDAIKTRGQEHTAQFESALADLVRSGDVRIVARQPHTKRTPVVSLDFPKRDNADIAHQLDRDFEIMTRCGLHCAPLAHRSLGTFPEGTVRFAFHHTHTPSDISYACDALHALLRRG